MKIALIGYGKMGHMVEEVAVNRGHSIFIKIDENNREQLSSLAPSEIDVAIEFTIPTTAADNIYKMIETGIPVVSGTTGWNDQLKATINYCLEKEGTFFYASNFSLGVNVLFEINRKLGRIMNRFKDYSVKIDETHHVHKKDKPSGTAITLAEDIVNEIERIKMWKAESSDENELLIRSFRENEVPGVHQVTYENDIDKIYIGHEARSRVGFALGAVLVSEWIIGKKGFYTMKDFLDL